MSSLILGLHLVLGAPSSSRVPIWLGGFWAEAFGPLEAVWGDGEEGQSSWSALRRRHQMGSVTRGFEEMAELSLGLLGRAGHQGGLWRAGHLPYVLS